MIKNNVCYCDNDDRIVENTEWSIIHVTVDRPQEMLTQSQAELLHHIEHERRLLECAWD